MMWEIQNSIGGIVTKDVPIINLFKKTYIDFKVITFDNINIDNSFLTLKLPNNNNRVMIEFFIISKDGDNRIKKDVVLQNINNKVKYNFYDIYSEGEGDIYPVINNNNTVKFYVESFLDNIETFYGHAKITIFE